MTFVEDRTSAHAAKANQALCNRNPPNFILKARLAPNSPGINTVENLWSIVDEIVFKDPGCCDS